MGVGVPAVKASVRILEMLAAHLPDAVPPGRIVEELGLNRSTCYNILSTLQKAGWVRNSGNRGGWTLGPRLLTLTGVSQEMTISAVLQEIDLLSRRLGLLVFVAEPTEEGGFTVTAKAEHVSGLRISLGVGDYLPFGTPALLYASAYALTDEEFDRQLRSRRPSVASFSREGELNLQPYFELLAETRSRGYSISMEELETYQGSVAAPIFDTHANVRMVLCSLAFFGDLNERVAARIGPDIRASADRITHRIGGKLPVESPVREPTRA